jgi:hypothetical protein
VRSPKPPPPRPRPPLPRPPQQLTAAISGGANTSYRGFDYTGDAGRANCVGSCLCNALTAGTHLPAAHPPAGGPRTPYTGALGVSILLYSDGSGTRVTSRFGPGGDRPGQTLLRVVEFSKGVTRVAVQLREVAGQWRLSGGWPAVALQLWLVLPRESGGGGGGHPIAFGQTHALCSTLCSCGRRAAVDGSGPAGAAQQRGGGGERQQAVGCVCRRGKHTMLG